MSTNLGAFALKNAPVLGQTGAAGIIKEHQWMPDGGGMQKMAQSMQTTDNSTVTIGQVPMLNDEMVAVDAWILGRSDDDAQRCFYQLQGLFYRSGAGNTTQEGSTTTVTSIETNAGLNGVLAVNTSPQEVRVNITGLDATTIRWKAFIKALKVVQPGA